MKKTLRIFSLTLLAASFMASCSVEKRHYLGGYHIEWKHKSKTAGTTADDSKGSAEVVAEETDTKEVITQNAVTQDQSPVMNATPANTNDQIEQNNEVAPVVKFISENKAQNIIVANNGQKSEIKQSTLKKAERWMKRASSSKSPMEPSRGLLFVLAFFIPWLAVGLATDWGMEVVWNLLWSLTCIGGIIHAFIIVSRET